VCPAQLGQLLTPHYDEVKAFDGEILALSHETVANNQALTDKHGVPFPMLSDTARQSIRDYDTADPLLGIAKIAFFLVDQDGIIRWKSTDHSNVDPNDLPEWEAIQQAFEEL
jgi:glutaredoxin-dependent peroxiredoxin